jgi:acyl dehydratase
MIWSSACASRARKKRVTREDIKRFASEFDPQAYHLDEAAAERSVFKGLAASGWHTAAIAMRLSVETRPFGPHPLLGLGVDELRWLAPVRPDDLLHLEGEVVELTPSRSKPQGISRSNGPRSISAVSRSTRLLQSASCPAARPDRLSLHRTAAGIVRRHTVYGFASDSVFSVT